MPLITRGSARRAGKPVDLIPRIAVGNPLARGLRLAITFNSSVVSVPYRLNNEPALFTGSGGSYGWLDSVHGRTVECPNGAAVEILNAGVYFSSQNLSVVTRMRLDTAENFSGFPHLARGTDGSDNVHLINKNGSNNSWESRIDGGAVAITTDSGYGPNDMADGVWRTYGWSRQGSDDVGYFVNGVRRGSATHSTTITHSATAGAHISDLRGLNSFQQIGAFAFVFFWDRGLSDAEMLSIARAPYQVFAPGRLWVPVGAAPPVTGDYFGPRPLLTLGVGA